VNLEANLGDEVSEKSPMIERLQGIASVLLKLRIPILLLALTSGVLFVASVLQMEGDRNSMLLPSLAGFCWAALLFAFAHLFAAIPERPRPSHGLLKRWSLEFRRFLMTVMAILMLVLTVTVVILTWQLLRTNFMS